MAKYVILRNETNIFNYFIEIKSNFIVKLSELIVRFEYGPPKKHKIGYQCRYFLNKLFLPILSFSYKQTKNG